MIDRTHALPVARQCQLLKLARSTAYYHPKPVADTTLALMRRIDELHLQYPFAGARMLRDLLRQAGHAIGRRQVATLMRRMGIMAIYRKPRTSQRHPAHQIYSMVQDCERHTPLRATRGSASSDQANPQAGESQNSSWRLSASSILCQATYRLMISSIFPP